MERKKKQLEWKGPIFIEQSIMGGGGRGKGWWVDVYGAIDGWGWGTVVAVLTCSLIEITRWQEKGEKAEPVAKYTV